MILTVYDKQKQCDKAIKGPDYIKAYLNGESVCDDSGISDFGGYLFTDDECNPVDFAAPESDGMLDLAIRAVVIAMAENGALSGPLESIVNRAIEIAHEKAD